MDISERPVVATSERFVIRRAFLLPLGILFVLCVALLAACMIQGEPGGKIAILSVIILPVGILFAESFFRRAEVGAQELTVIKLLRRKTLRFPEVTALETIQVRKRAFVTVCAGDDFLILSNAYGDFPRLVETLMDRVPPQAVSEETQRMASAPPRKNTDIVSCWLAVALVGFILFLQLGGRF